MATWLEIWCFCIVVLQYSFQNSDSFVVFALSCTDLSTILLLCFTVLALFITLLSGLLNQNFLFLWLPSIVNNIPIFLFIRKHANAHLWFILALLMWQFLGIFLVRFISTSFEFVVLCFDIGSDEYVKWLDDLSICSGQGSVLFFLMQKLSIVKYFERNWLSLDYFLLWKAIVLH